MPMPYTQEREELCCRLLQVKTNIICITYNIRIWYFARYLSLLFLCCTFFKCGSKSACPCNPVLVISQFKVHGTGINKFHRCHPNWFFKQSVCQQYPLYLNNSPPHITFSGNLFRKSSLPIFDSVNFSNAAKCRKGGRLLILVFESYSVRKSL